MGSLGSLGSLYLVVLRDMDESGVFVDWAGDWISDNAEMFPGLCEVGAMELRLLIVVNMVSNVNDR